MNVIEYAKHFFVDKIELLDSVRKSFKLKARKLIDSRSKQDGLDVAFYDYTMFTYQLSHYKYDNFEQLQKGIRAIKQFIFSESYQIEKAIIHSAKAAYLTSIIKNNASEIEKFISSDQVKDFEIKDQNINRLNRLRKSNPEAFFYWYKIFELESAGING